ncbi:MAG: Gx transporter family protein [Treponema sp.]|nr:Gx transporter family protein [Treponema sp.]
MNSKQRLNQLSFFSALCLFLSAVEYAIPKPMPFMRVGLANLPVLMAVKKMPARWVLVLVMLKILLQAFISGTLFSYVFLFSLAGSMASGIIIILLNCIFNKTDMISFIGLSVAGSLANNAAQIVCAKFIMFGDNVRYVAPLLLISGFVTGLLLGIFANIFEQESYWYAECSEEFSEISMQPVTECDKKSLYYKGLVVILLFIPCFFMLYTDILIIEWCIVAFFFILVLISRKGKVRILPSVIVICSVTLLALLSPYGKVLMEAGRFKITEGALKNGLKRSGVLVGMVFASRCIVSRNVALPGKAGCFISKVFFLFDSLTSAGKLSGMKVRKGSVLKQLDAHLMEMYKLTF